MLIKSRNIDVFTRNIIIVFIGTSLANFLNLLYQLLIAHRFSAADFAAFNALFSIVILISSTLNTLQLAVAKYCSELRALNQINKIRILLSSLFKKASILAGVTFLIFLSISNYIMDILKISSYSCGYILAGLLALSWLTPIFLGGVQGLELFTLLASGSVLTGISKLVLAYIFVMLGFNISGALGAALLCNVVYIIFFYFPLRGYLTIKPIKVEIASDSPELSNKLFSLNGGLNYKVILLYLFPIGISYFCFFSLVSFDMVLVRYFFSAQDSGLYSLAQMLGKIFLFLPSAISLVLFPRASGLKAKNMDTASAIKESLFYTAVLCLIACLTYNLSPGFVLKILTGKVHPESIFLGRLFSISMSFFALSFVLISYFLSIKELRFIKYLILLTALQFVAIFLFHKSLVQVQLVLCINATLLFLVHLILIPNKMPEK